MISILVVEDEKMIRQGIVSMIKRSDTAIGDIIECRNGLEALEVLKTRSIDIMFTDIRMPKMDGITLLQHVSQMETRPHTVVISGYEDFNYALAALKNGVEDYLLKPIERDRLHELLEKLSGLVTEEQKQTTQQKDINCQQIKYFMISESLSEEERTTVTQQFAGESLFQSYTVICTEKKGDLDLPEEKYVRLSEVEGDTVYIVEESGTESILTQLSTDDCLGFSKPHIGIEGLKEAYQEACSARILAYVMEKNSFSKQADNQYKIIIPSEFSEQLAQRLGTDEYEKDLNTLESYRFYAKNRQTDPWLFVEMLQDIPRHILRIYGQIIEHDPEAYRRISRPLAYGCATEYLHELRLWMAGLRELIFTEFDDYQKKELMNKALRFIEENYHKNLNMAMVSNYISMNYSLFSISFKQYTGVNFVNYLKRIRINEAKRLLSTTDEKIIDISKQVGYDNEKHFMKTFKSICGISPSAYRKNMQFEKSE